MFKGSSFDQFIYIYMLLRLYVSGVVLYRSPVASLISIVCMDLPVAMSVPVNHMAGGYPI